MRLLAALTPAHTSRRLSEVVDRSHSAFIAFLSLFKLMCAFDLCERPENGTQQPEPPKPQPLQKNIVDYSFFVNLKFARIYERCRMEQLSGWELAHKAAHAANRR